MDGMRGKMFFIGSNSSLDNGMDSESDSEDFTFTLQGSDPVQATIKMSAHANGGVSNGATSQQPGSRYVRSGSVPEMTAASAAKRSDDDDDDDDEESGQGGSDSDEGSYFDQSDVERDGGEDEEEEGDETYDDFDVGGVDRQNSGRKGKQKPTEPGVPDKLLSKVAPVRSKMSCVEPPTFLKDKIVDSLAFGDEDRDLPKPLLDLESVCTIGTGTFGRVLLVKKNKHQATTHNDDDESTKENQPLVPSTASTNDQGADSKENSARTFYALKMMTIRCVIKTRQVSHVHSEKNILQKLSHPFIVKLHWTCRDNKCLYMLFDYAPGGELFSYLRASGRFGNRTTRFYAAEIVSALEYMHRLNIVYRDLKPENLLLDKDGHLKITDFGFAKELSDRTWTLCGTPEYLAPEVIANKGHNKAVDWWALGVLIYEMHAGFPPYCGDNALAIYNRILEGKLKFPPSFNLVAKDLVRKLLQTDRTKRIGSMKDGASDVKQHKWFHQLSWTEVDNRKLEPPIVPTLYSEGDTGNFDSYEEADLRKIAEVSKSDLELFKDW